jgi:hypothetical protein
MRQIRKSVFETNSSSTHSVSIQKSGRLDSSYLKVDEEDNKVHVQFGEFGWGVESFYSQEEKLSYLCTMVAEAEGRNLKTEEDFYNSEGFQLINGVVSEYCNCDGVVIDNANFKTTSWGLEHEGYIDHQSCEYSSLQEFLNDYDTNVIEFIFNNGVVLHTDNDNH